MPGARQPSLPRLLLVTGMSGAGKSAVLDSLEDMGWECVDNLPMPLLVDFVGEARRARRPMAVAPTLEACCRNLLSGSGARSTTLRCGPTCAVGTSNAGSMRTSRSARIR